MVLKEAPVDIGPTDAPSGRRWLEAADGWLLVGCILSGTMILGPIGPIVLGIAFWKLYKTVKAGTNPGHGRRRSSARSVWSTA